MVQAPAHAQVLHDLSNGAQIQAALETTLARAPPCLASPAGSESLGDLAVEPTECTVGELWEMDSCLTYCRSIALAAQELFAERRVLMWVGGGWLPDISDFCEVTSRGGLGALAGGARPVSLACSSKILARPKLPVPKVRCLRPQKRLAVARRRLKRQPLACCTLLLQWRICVLATNDATISVHANESMSECDQVGMSAVGESRFAAALTECGCRSCCPRRRWLRK